MDRYLIVDDTTGEVVNVILWDGIEPYDPPAGTTAVQAADEQVGIGWTLEGDGSATPPPPEEQEGV